MEDLTDTKPSTWVRYNEPDLCPHCGREGEVQKGKIVCGRCHVLLRGCCE